MPTPTDPPTADAPPPHERLALALRRARREHGLSQRALARLLHMSSHTSIGDWEHARRVPSDDTLGLYERRLGLREGELRTLRRELLVADAALAAEAALSTVTVRPAAALPPAPAPAPAPAGFTVVRPTAALPPVPADFSGRSDDVAALRTLLTGPAAAPVVVSGPPGIGKTTLALHVGHATADRFPDGHLFADLRGTQARTDGDTGTAAALHTLLSGLGVPDQRIPADIPARSALLRGLLADRRVLVILDDAAGEAQVRPLLPGNGGSRALVTSRARLSGLAGVHRLTLDPLPDTDAQSLLAAIAGPGRTAREPDAAADIVAGCGGLPLAVRIAASRLAVSPAWSLAHLSAQLRDERTRLSLLKAGDSDIRQAFACTYRHLTPLQARLFRLLPLVPAPHTGTEAAAALLGRDARHAAEALDDLAEAGLLTPAPAPGRWQLHDLLRLYATEQSAAQDRPAARAAAAQRLHHWLVDTAHRAASALSPARTAFPGGEQAALSWLDGEQATLLGLMRTAPGTRDWPVGLAPLVTVLSWYFDRRCRWEAMAEAGRTTATRAEDDAERAAGLNALGLARLEQGRHAQAVEHHREALAAARRADDWYQEADALSKTGLAYWGLGRYTDAVQCHRADLRLAQANDDRARQASALSHLGTALRLAGHFDEALDALARARTIWTGLGTARGIAMADYRTACVYADQGRHPEALTTARAALDLFHTFEDAWGPAGAHQVIARALEGLGRHEEAATAYRHAAGLFTAVSDTHRAEQTTLALRALEREGPGHIPAGFRFL
ncbi:tetratricopeptide repeat protein [Streptomyces sp. NPDC094032]|uniref:ATP-binding protein n=1 Tax=Streptomyces sp. NPDC094032 TaxID=3155308 RepID=UPI003326EEB6